MRIRARHAAEVLGARLVGEPGVVANETDCVFDGVSFDTRSIRAGQLFVPIVAERDGHDFIPAAVAGGAAAYLTARPHDVVAGAVAIVVDDTLAALMRLGAWGRERWGVARPEARVVGITGSVGKTSTKDLAAAALSAGARTWANARSFNNDQGLPSTILDAPDDTDVMVLEMGMRGFGEIARLAAIGRPHIGIVTRVAEAHTELVGDVHGVARAKGELIEALPSDGAAILNGDDDLVRAMRNRTSARVLLYGESADVDVRIIRPTVDKLARGRFDVDTPWGRHRVQLSVSGRHMIENAAAALAVAGVLGHDVGAAAEALSSATLSPWRMEVTQLRNGAVLINDAYNANPTSMRAALDALAGLPAERRVAVLGPMAEIANPEIEHQAIAAYAQRLGIELIAVGTAMYGVRPSRDPLAALGSLAGGSAVLVKASRSAGLDRLAGVIVERHGGLVLEVDDAPA